MKKWTGERLEPVIFNENTLEHLHRYALVRAYTKDKVVLDLASGEGYGSNLIADDAGKVIGVDIAAETIAAAKSKYARPNLEFLVGSAVNIPCEKNFFDVVVSFETIEHHDQHDEMLMEIKRVLKPGGLLIISTPDKKYYSDKRNYKNTFHIKELYFSEFDSLLGKYFGFRNYLFQKCQFNSIIFSAGSRQNGYTEYTGDYDHTAVIPEPEYVYVIAVCSDISITDIPGLSVFHSEEVFSKMLNSSGENVKSGLRYKIGNLVLAPFVFVKRLFRSR